MPNNQLIQNQNTARTSSRHLFFFLALSLLPIYTFTRSRWSARLGLDQLHLVLLQLIFTYFFSQRFSSQTGTSSGSKPDQEDHSPTQGLEEKNNKSKSERPISDTSLGIAKSLQEIVDRPSDWTNVYPTPGIEILKHRTISSLYAVRTEFEEDHSLTLEQLVRCIRESKQWEWDRMCECGEDLGDGVTWVRLKGFWPIKPKELVMRSCMFRLPGSPDEDEVSKPPIRILAASSSTTHPLKKSTLEIKFAGYLIEQLSASSGFRVTQVVDLSGFGALPTFVTKAIVCKFVPSSLRKLVALAQHLPPLPPSTSGAPASWMPPSLNDSITVGRKASTERDRLRLEINQLKKIILDLQHQKLGKTFQEGSSWTNRLSLPSISLAGAALAIGFSFAYKTRLYFNRRDKVRWM